MENITSSEIDNISIDEEWNYGKQTEYLMHTIHPYPAKFPSFIAAKAFDYAKSEGVSVKSVADIFCGCGTVALEAKIHDKSFWGCDINPVATLIAKTKSESYQVNRLVNYFNNIDNFFHKLDIPNNQYENANDRLRYWFTCKSYETLFNLKVSIENSVPSGKYRNAFFCIFSSILKASSRWLTKSIKPQIDPDKPEIDIFKNFTVRFDKFLQSIEEINKSVVIKNKKEISICTHNFLNLEKLPKVDLIISSPPYVTSYEYADLHQLSTLWLGYADDYRDLRKGSIGSVYNSENYELPMESLNSVGNSIVSNLLEKLKDKAQIRSVGRYYIDIQQAIQKCSSMLSEGGMALFVVGDTEYKDVKILNSKHLIQSLSNEGFTDIKIAKRRISNKLLTPYRDNLGRFSSDKSQRKIYHEEFIISGRK